VTVQAQIIELIKKLQAELDMAVVMITHDLGVVADIADSVMVMYAGRPVEKADRDTRTTARTTPTPAGCSSRSRSEAGSTSSGPSRARHPV
jgi:ABC-type dipeptide/oligopeptide/nickel transport system ATPase component